MTGVQRKYSFWYGPHKYKIYKMVVEMVVSINLFIIDGKLLFDYEYDGYIHNNGSIYEERS